MVMWERTGLASLVNGSADRPTWALHSGGVCMNFDWKAHRRLLFGSLLGVALVAAVACGSDDDDGADDY